MGGVFSSPSAPAPAPAPIAAPAPAPKAAEPVKATSEETKVAANTRARRRMGTRLLFSQERSAGLGTDQTTLGGGAGPGQNTLA
jgi:hypothetical protein